MGICREQPQLLMFQRRVFGLGSGPKATYVLNCARRYVQKDYKCSFSDVKEDMYVQYMYIYTWSDRSGPVCAVTLSSKPMSKNVLWMPFTMFPMCPGRHRRILIGI